MKRNRKTDKDAKKAGGDKGKKRRIRWDEVRFFAVFS